MTASKRDVDTMIGVIFRPTCASGSVKIYQATGVSHSAITSRHYSLQRNAIRLAYGPLVLPRLAESVVSSALFAVLRSKFNSSGRVCMGLQILNANVLFWEAHHHHPAFSSSFDVMLKAQQYMEASLPQCIALHYNRTTCQV